MWARAFCGRFQDRAVNRGRSGCADVSVLMWLPAGRPPGRHRSARMERHMGRHRGRLLRGRLADHQLVRTQPGRQPAPIRLLLSGWRRRSARCPDRLRPLDCRCAYHTLSRLPVLHTSQQRLGLTEGVMPDHLASLSCTCTGWLPCITRFALQHIG